VIRIEVQGGTKSGRWLCPDCIYSMRREFDNGGREALCTNEDIVGRGGDQRLLGVVVECNGFSPRDAMHLMERQSKWTKDAALWIWRDDCGGVHFLTKSQWNDEEYQGELNRQAARKNGKRKKA
jgi:hypothetical protein